MGKVVHRLSNIDPAQRTADCAGCGTGHPVIWQDYKGRWACKTSASRRSSEALRQRELDLRERKLKRFGITGADYAELLEAQHDVCAICRRPCPTGRRLAVDHNHATGAVRGLLCGPCNQGLGMFGEDLERLTAAITYLIQAK